MSAVTHRPASPRAPQMMSRTYLGRSGFDASPQDIGVRFSQVLHAVAGRPGGSIERCAAALRLARSKVYEIFAGEKNLLVEFLYRCTDRELARALLADIASVHDLEVVDVVHEHAAESTLRDGLRLVEEVASACGTAVVETAKAVADHQVDAEEGAELEERGLELKHAAERLIALGRRAKRERSVKVGG